MLQSIYACLSVQVMNTHRNQKPHWIVDEIENWQNWKTFRQSKSLSTFQSCIKTEYHDWSNDWKHFYEHFNVSSDNQEWKTQQNFFFSDFFDILPNKVFPSIVLDDSYSGKILINAFWTFIKHLKLTFPDLKTFIK